jgi:hypothetical protein
LRLLRSRTQPSAAATDCVVVDPHADWPDFACFKINTAYRNQDKTPSLAWSGLFRSRPRCLYWFQYTRDSQTLPKTIYVIDLKRINKYGTALAITSEATRTIRS